LDVFGLIISEGAITADETSTGVNGVTQWQNRCSPLTKRFCMKSFRAELRES
jgi:hypothetical protein